MKTLDRAVLLFAGSAGWALVMVLVLTPTAGVGLGIHAREVDGLTEFVKSVAEGCQVSGPVNVVRDRGELRGGRITC